MKKVLLFAALFGLLAVNHIQAQKKVYGSGGSEMIFSFASTEFITTDLQKIETGNVMRWAPVLNYSVHLNYDPSSWLGLFTGLAVRNVGFIYNVPETDHKYKYRTYNLGVPIGIKVGNVNGFFVYGGYEIEYAFNYKEKFFKNTAKQTVDVYWFTDRVEQFPQSILVGINFPYGFNIKFKYYLNNFHNKDYVSGIDDLGNEIKPYEALSSNVFYFSLCFGIFNPFKSYYDPKQWDDVY
jgi:hypothetical protein